MKFSNNNGDTDIENWLLLGISKDSEDNYVNHFIS
jgi:hypothetical protein